MQQKLYDYTFAAWWDLTLSSSNPSSFTGQDLKTYLCYRAPEAYNSLWINQEVFLGAYTALGSYKCGVLSAKHGEQLGVCRDLTKGTKPREGV